MHSPTIGIEEEFLLIDPTDRRPRALSAAVLDVASETDGEVEGELQMPQVETTTRSCRSLEELAGQVRAARRGIGLGPPAAPTSLPWVPHPWWSSLSPAWVCGTNGSPRGSATQPRTSSAAPVTCMSRWNPRTRQSRCWTGSGRGGPAARPDRQLAVLTGPGHQPGQLPLRGVDALALGGSDRTVRHTGHLPRHGAGHGCRLPGVYRTQTDTWLLASVVRSLARGRNVLDLCTGTGALAIAAAQAGARSVTATDLSHRSVATARANGILRGVPLRVRRGDLFAPVRSERFDLVLANTPYVPSATDRLPRHTEGRSWDAGSDGRLLIDRICAQVAGMLTVGGAVLLAQSTMRDEHQTMELLGDSGLSPSVLARCTLPFGSVLGARVAMLEAAGMIEPCLRHSKTKRVAAQPNELVLQFPAMMGSGEPVDPLGGGGESDAVCPA